MLLGLPQRLRIYLLFFFFFFFKCYFCVDILFINFDFKNETNTFNDKISFEPKDFLQKWNPIQKIPRRQYQNSAQAPGEQIKNSRLKLSADTHSIPRNGNKFLLFFFFL